MKLSDCTAPRDTVVTGINAPYETAQRLSSLGISAGSRIKILHKNRGGAVISVMGTRLALGAAAAETVQVEDGSRNEKRR